MSTDPKPEAGGKEVPPELQPKPGGKDAAEQLIEKTKGIIDQGHQREQQLSLLDPVSPEEMAIAQEELGPKAGSLAVLQHARSTRRGRKKGSRNRRTEDFRKYILKFGRHPAQTLMEIQNTPPEVLVERSRMLDAPKQQLTYGAALAHIERAAEALMPFIESKQPVAVELSADGDFNLLIPGINIDAADAERAAAGEFVLDAEYSDVDEEGET